MEINIWAAIIILSLLTIVGGIVGFVVAVVVEAESKAKESKEKQNKTKQGRELVYGAVINGASWSTCTKAAKNWVPADKWSENTCDFAAMHGYLDILKAARENG